MAYLLIQIVQAAAWLISAVVIVDIVLSYFVSPYNPIRAFLDRIVQPLLRPIQRFVPTFGGLDFSPFILLIGIQLIESILINVISMVR